ncbi:hypothetical protein NL676_029334 [Syzygium grande]|nr:hypothetical protein NL676_029334 [Syzygium grande]
MRAAIAAGAGARPLRLGSGRAAGCSGRAVRTKRKRRRKFTRGNGGGGLVGEPGGVERAREARVGERAAWSAAARSARAITSPPTPHPRPDRPITEPPGGAPPRLKKSGWIRLDLPPPLTREALGSRPESGRPDRTEDKSNFGFGGKPSIRATCA